MELTTDFAALAETLAGLLDARRVPARVAPAADRFSREEMVLFKLDLDFDGVPQRVVGLRDLQVLKGSFDRQTVWLADAIADAWKRRRATARLLPGVERAARARLGRNDASHVQLVGIEPQVIDAGRERWPREAAATLRFAVLNDSLKEDVYEVTVNSVAQARAGLNMIVVEQAAQRVRKAEAEAAGADAFIDGATIALIRWMDGDPGEVVRDLATGGFSVLHRHDGSALRQMTLEMRCGRLLGAVDVGRRASWQDDTLSVWGVQLADTLVCALPGRPVRALVDHPAFAGSVIDAVKVDEDMLYVRLRPDPHLLRFDTGAIWREEEVSELKAA